MRICAKTKSFAVVYSQEVNFALSALCFLARSCLRQTVDAIPINLVLHLQEKKAAQDCFSHYSNGVD